KEVLRPLLAGCRNSDGALSEELFPFYAEQLERNPNDFLAALATFPTKEQQQICELTGEGDGGGMGPEDLRKVHHNLMKAGGDVSARCARSYRAGDKLMKESNSDLPAETPKK